MGAGGRCPQCNQIVTTNPGTIIAAHQPPGSRAKCPGTGQVSV